MKKITRFLVLSAFLVMSAAVHAVPAWPGKHRAVLTDGTVVSFRMVGDEYSHHLVSDDGYLLSPTADGRFQRNGLYAEQQSQLMAQARKAKAAAPKRLQVDPELSKGEIRGLVLLVEFADNSFQPEYDQAFFSRKMNEAGYDYNGATGSCRDYYIAQSDGQFQPTFDVVGPIKLKHNMAYYGANGGVNNSDVRPQDMVVEASTFAHDSLGVDFSPYDNNHDGKVDFVYVYYAGYAESYGAATYTIWPHASNLIQQGVYASFDGVVLDRYACSSELRYTTGTEIEGIGTFCHEFGHVLGLPDMYDTMYSAETLGAWDLMCSGSYCNDSRTPPGFSAYERSTVGWMELQTIDTPADSLPLHELQASKEAYRINCRGANKDEYFILENRRHTGWDTYLPGEGMLIWRIYYNATAWQNNTVNSGKDYIDILEAKGYNGGKTAAFPQPGVDSFTDYSTPSALSLDGVPTERGVTHIQDNDGVISFRYMKDRLPRPQNLYVSDVTSHGFTANWAPVDEAHDYSVSIREVLREEENPVILGDDFSGMTDGDYPISGAESIDASLDKYTSQAGWGGTNVYSAGGYVRIGGYNQAGELVTPVISQHADNGNAYLSLRAIGYPSKRVGYTITLRDAATGNVVEQYSLTGDGRSEAQQDLVFHQVPAAYRVAIATTKERLFVNDLRVMNDSIVGDAVWTAGPKSWTIDSIADTNVAIDSLVAGRTYLFSVQALAVGLWTGSLPSATQTVTLPVETGICQPHAELGDAEILSIQYFDLSGRQLSVKPSSGLFIRRVRYADGTVVQKIVH